MEKYLIAKPSKFADEEFEAVIEEDFNPDVVHLALYETYAAGKEDGMVKGAAITGGIIGACIGAFYAIRGFIKRKKAKELEQKTEEA